MVTAAHCTDVFASNKKEEKQCIQKTKTEGIYRKEAENEFLN
jgi:hypothetical protein